MQIVPWMVLAGSSLWLMWKPKIKGDPAIKANFLRHLKATRIHIVASVAYIVYNAAYKQLTRQAQSFFVLLLPVMKVLFKTKISNALDHLEDLTPVIVVFHIDVFHSLFVSLTIQQTAMNNSVVALTMAVDLAQFFIALYEVRTVLNRLHELSKTLEGSNVPDSGSIRPTIKRGMMGYTAWSLQSNERVRTNPTITLPRSQRKYHQPRSPEQTSSGRQRKWRCFSRGRSIHPVAVRPTADLQPGEPLTSLEREQVEYSQKTLKLLYMTEFYVLIEYAEVMITVFFAVYMFALSHLPNRVYYSQFVGLSDEELRNASSRIGLYASLELLTFVAFCGLLDFQIEGFSVLRQLAFTLRRHWKLIQSTVVVWVFVAVQIKFQHFGNDFTFKFKWLRGDQSK